MPDGRAAAVPVPVARSLGRRGAAVSLRRRRGVMPGDGELPSRGARGGAGLQGGRASIAATRGMIRRPISIGRHMHRGSDTLDKES